MKKIKIFLSFLVAASLLVASCSDPYADQFVAEPGGYEQEALQSADFVASVTNSTITITSSDLENTFEFITLSSIPELVNSEANIEYSIILSDSTDFVTYESVDITSQSASKLSVGYSQLNDVLKSLNSESTSHSAYARVLAYIIDGSTKALYTTESLTFDVTTYNYPPVAVNDSVVTAVNKQLTYDVLANDTDTENDDLTLVSAEGASNGTVTIVDNSIVYTPNADYTGTDEFTYTASDGINTATAKVVVTITNIVQMWVVGSYNGWDNSDNASYILSTETSNGQAEGYVYLTTDGIKLVTDHSWDDAHTFGDDGSGNLTNPGNNITVSEDGYYLIKANLNDMTYSLTKTVWGVIGSATPTGWSGQTNMTYDPTSKTFRLGMHLTADGGAFKFRGTDDWSINYGNTAADGATLDAGGTDIPVDLESDYAITLDLSHPNEYTYSANRWGLIGSSTANGWSSDQNLSWDETNQVFTITLDLVAGEVKFRANDGWVIDLGGDLNALTFGGSNIAISEDGNYTITLDPWELKGTIIKN